MSEFVSEVNLIDIFCVHLILWEHLAFGMSIGHSGDNSQDLREL